MAIRHMNWRQNVWKLAAFALRAFQHVVHVAGQKPLPQAHYQRLNVHRLVEVAGRRIGAVEVQPVRSG